MFKKILLGLLILVLISFLLFSFANKKDNEIDKLDLSKDNANEELNEVNNESDTSIEERDYLRLDSNGSVDVSVAFNNIIKTDENDLVFEIFLNTHSVDLDNIDYKNIAIIRTNDKIEVDSGFSWEILGGSGHHISGLLKVPNNIDGNKILNENTEYLELELKNIGEVDSKKFKWDSEALKNIDNIK